MTRRLGSAALLTATLLLGAPAAASPSYPPEIKSHLGLESAPACTLCHQGTPNYGSATTLFATTARKTYGLSAAKTSKLDTVLDAMEADQVDSDGDGVSDIDELKAGTDPNTAGGITAAPKPELVYGCQARIAGGQSSGAAGLGFLTLALALRLARRRRLLGMTGALAAAATAALLSAGCYEVSYVSPEVCATGLGWTAGDTGSPNMHPGAACKACHQENGGPTFQVAGTVFPGAGLADDCFGAYGAEVLITGADGQTVKITTTESGNFYTELPIKTPYHAEVIVGGKSNSMAGEQTNGDCNSCHTVKGANAAPGRILIP